MVYCFYHKVMKRDLLLSAKHVYLIGRETIKKGPDKGKIVEIVKRKLTMDQIGSLSLRWVFATFKRCFLIIYDEFAFQPDFWTPSCLAVYISVSQ